jgi:hypothetical protein
VQSGQSLKPLQLGWGQTWLGREAIEMAILNYTTTIDPFKTIGEIQAILVRHGALNVSTDYVDQCPSALTFLVDLKGEFVSFRLPSNHTGVYNALRRDAAVPKKFKTEEQARRVAWRIVKDWVEAQMAVTQAGLATLPEVFLPYAVTASGLTLYESVSQHGMKALTAGLEGGDRL